MDQITKHHANQHPPPPAGCIRLYHERLCRRRSLAGLGSNPHPRACYIQHPAHPFLSEVAIRNDLLCIRDALGSGEQLQHFRLPAQPLAACDVANH